MEALAQLRVAHDQVDQRAVLRAGDVELAERAGLAGPDRAFGVGVPARAHALTIGPVRRAPAGTFDPFPAGGARLADLRRVAPA